MLGWYLRRTWSRHFPDRNICFNGNWWVVRESVDGFKSQRSRQKYWRLNRKNPIKIRASASNGVVKVDILGIKQDDDYEVVLDSKVVSSIKFSTKYEENSALEEGKEKIIQNGVNGSIGEAYKILKKNGKVVSRTLISRDTYSAKPQIIQKGTKKKNNDNNNNNNNDENSNNSKSKNTENKNNENKNTSSVTIENVDMNSVKNEIKNNNKPN